MTEYEYVGILKTIFSLRVAMADGDGFFIVDVWMGRKSEEP